MNIPSENHKPQEPDTAPAEVAEAQTLASARRRRLIKLGAITPVVLTAVSRPVHAAGTCVNPSGFISVTTFNSRHPGATVCTTNGPSFWKGKITNSAPYTSKFKDVFGGSYSNSVKLSDVLNGATTEFDRYCVAAYLNASAGGFSITVNQARGFWATIKGTTLPAGISAYPTVVPAWDEPLALIWLKSQMSA